MQLTPKYTDHEWVLYLGFDKEVLRDEFLKDLKEIIKDYWYKQKAANAGDSFSKDDIKAPVAGELQIFLTEGKSLGVDLFRKELARRGGKLTSGKIQIKVGFRSPKSLVDLFNSVFVDETLMESLSSNLNKEDIYFETDIIDNPTWRTPTQPAGQMRNLGRLVKLPKSNALLTITASTTFMENGVEQTYIFGDAEYFS